MSFDAYTIAVKLSLVNGLSGGLVNIARQFISLHGQAGKTNAELSVLEGKLKSIGKMTLIGGALAGAGIGMLGSLRGPIQEAMEWERQAAKLRQMGLGSDQVKDAQKFVQATDIIGTSMQQRMKLFTEAQGSFRESGMGGTEALNAARTMMPVLANYEVAMSTLSGDKHAAAEGAMRNLNKTVEMMGGLGNLGRAQEIAAGVFKAAQSSGKMVDERQLKQFVAYASSAGNQQSLRTIFGGLEPIIGELGGSTTAVGLRTAYTRANGMMSLPPRRLIEEMQRLGMTDSTGKQQTAQLAQLQATNVIDYALEVMKRYESHGIVSQTDRERENSIIFGTNGAKVFNKIMSQMATISLSLKSYDAAQSPDQVNGAEKDGPLMAVKKFDGALHDLSLTIGQTVLPILTPAIQGLTAFFKKLEQYPDLVRVVTFGFVGLATVMAIGGTLTLAAAGFQAVGLALGIAGVAGGGGGLVGALSGVLGPLGLVIGLFTTLGLIAAGDAKGHEYDKTLKTDRKGFMRRGHLGGVQMPLPEGVEPSTAGAGRGNFVPPGGGRSGGMPSTIQLVPTQNGRPLAEYIAGKQAKGLSGNLGSGAFDLGVSQPAVNLRTN